MAKDKPRALGILNPLDHSFKGKNGKTYKLTAREREFCKHFLNLYGDRVQALVDAGYNIYYKDKKGNPTENINYSAAKTLAYQMLSREHIVAYIEQLLEEYGYTEDKVEKQHLFVINQFSDIPSKVRAIELFYKKIGKLVDTKPSETPAQINIINFHSSKPIEKKETKPIKVVEDSSQSVTPEPKSEVITEKY